MTLGFQLLILAIVIAVIGLRLVLSRRPRNAVPWFTLHVWSHISPLEIVLWAWTVAIDRKQSPASSRSGRRPLEQT
jgi:hypothetical protein